MTDSQQDTYRAMWELIPWYVNETLTAKERAAVERHAAACPAFRREIADQQRLATAMSETDVAEQQAEAAWRNIQDRITAKRRWAWPAIRIVPMGLTVAASAAALLFVALPQFGPQERTGYTTLTVDPSASQVSLKVRPVPGADPAEVKGVLEAAGLRAVAAASETGLITVQVPADLNAVELAEALMKSPHIAFVAGDF